jgi:hypothetical protein
MEGSSEISQKAGGLANFNHQNWDSAKMGI